MLQIFPRPASLIVGASDGIRDIEWNRNDFFVFARAEVPPPPHRSTVHCVVILGVDTACKPHTFVGL